MCKNKKESACAYKVWAYHETNVQDKVEITYANYKWTVNKPVNAIVGCTSGHK